MGGRTMGNCSSYEKDILKSKMANSFNIVGYYPNIVRYHNNELMSYFDNLNLDYTVKRKEHIKQVTNKVQLEEYIKEIKAAYMDCYGDMPKKTDIKSEVVRTIDKGDYLIDIVLIESLPGYFLSANYYYPKNLNKKAPGILFLCGHSEEGKASNIYISFCVEAALNGFCVLTFDPLGQGERFMYGEKDGPPFDKKNPDHVHYTLGQRISLTGDSITKYMMWDNIRALDYLCARDEVDTTRLAVTGNSGGGQMSAFMGAYDERLSVVAPSCYITDLRSMIYYIGAQESEQSMPGFMKQGLDLADLITMAAPKPYFMGSALLDFFPIEGARDAFVEARRFYSMLDAEDNIGIYTAPKPHGFWFDTRVKVLNFLCEHLDMKYIQDKNINYDNLPKEEELLCTKDGDIDSYNTVTIHQIIQSRCNDVYPNIAETDIDNLEVFKAYKDKITKSAIEILGIDGSIIRYDIDTIKKHYDEEKGIFISDISLYSEKYMKIYCTLYEKDEGQNDSVMLHVGDIQDIHVIDKYLKDHSAVLCVEPRGTGRGKMIPGCWFYEGDEIQNEEASYNCNADMLGRSVMGMMVLDVLSVKRLIESKYGDVKIDIYGKEENAIIALFTALLGNIRDVTLAGLLYSYKSMIDNKTHTWKPSIFAYGLLAKFDIADLLLALLPANITIDAMLDNRKNVVNQSLVDKIIERIYYINKSFYIKDANL